MVARIKYTGSISYALRYNERKIAQGNASFLWASGFIKDTGRITYTNILKHFERLISLNERTRNRVLHLSLNFSPADRLDTGKLREIAIRYMEKIGFKDQPFVVYRHDDAGHPHLHIVSSGIRAGEPSLLLNPKPHSSVRMAQAEINKEFGLAKPAESVGSILPGQPVRAQRAKYGGATTTSSIESVLAAVLPRYKFTSLSALNAILNLYNVHCNRGSVHSKMYLHNGLTYQVLDHNGHRRSMPIKASRLYSKPTLAFLKTRFAENAVLRMPFQKKLQVTLGWVLRKDFSGTDDLKNALEKENITAVIWKNRENVPYGITYIDHRSQCIFHGSEMGRPFNMKSVLQKMVYRESQKLLAAEQEQKWLPGKKPAGDSLLPHTPGEDRSPYLRAGLSPVKRDAHIHSLKPKI